MARSALIKDGTVVNIIEVGWNYVPPDDHRLVESETASIGDTHDGRDFGPPPPAPKHMLRTHAARRFHEQPQNNVRVGGHTIMVTFQQHELVSALAKRAQRDSSFVFDWPDVSDTSRTKLTRLSATELIALDDAVTDMVIKNATVLGNLLRGVDAGTVTDHDHIDGPTAGWAARKDEPPA